MLEPLHAQLLSQARRLAQLDAKKPKQGNLRRAISSAYYGLFHFMIDEATRSVIGMANERRPYRDVLARAFEHGVMAKACESFGGGTLPAHLASRLPAGFMVPKPIRQLAQTFKDAQEKRHLADYDRSAYFVRDDVLSQVQGIQQAIRDFSTIKNGQEARFFLNSLLIWDRLDRRK